MTLGQTIGKVRHSFTITNDAKNKVQLAVTVDFSTASDVDIKSWLVSNRIIAGQRPWRALSASEIRELDGTTILATDIGKKIKSREERIATYVSSGLPRLFAELAVDNPVKFQAVQARALAAMEEEEDDIERIIDNLNAEYRVEGPEDE